MLPAARHNQQRALGLKLAVLPLHSPWMCSLTLHCIHPVTDQLVIGANHFELEASGLWAALHILNVV